MPPFALDLHPILAPYDRIIPTRCLLVAQGALAKTVATVRDYLPCGRWVLVADAKTWPVAGPALQSQLEQAHIDYATHVLAADPAPSLEKVDEIQTHLRGACAVLAIGAGTINDLAKMAAHRVGIPYAIVATAPSMNGYTSSIAALLEQGVKTTRPCAAPVAVIADIDILAQAPYRMVAAGLGDLLSKPVSQADWLLAHHLTGSSYSQRAAKLIDASADLLDGVPARLPERNPAAVGHLIGSLLLSGLAMTVAGSSAPSSGGEHLISHYFDMTHYAFGEANDLHGCQVGVATLATAALYAKLLAFDPADIDVAALMKKHTPWEEVRPMVAARFTSLADAVLPHAREKHPTAHERKQRLAHLKENWREIISKVAVPLNTPAQIRAQLDAARAPTTFADLGVTPARARRAILHSKDIRARYTILDLLDELGVLERWSDEVLR